MPFNVRSPPSCPSNAVMKCSEMIPPPYTPFFHIDPLRKTLSPNPVNRYQHDGDTATHTNPYHHLSSSTTRLRHRILRRARSTVSARHPLHRPLLLLVSLTASTHHATALPCARATASFLITSCLRPSLSTSNPSTADADAGGDADTVADEYPVGVTIAKGVPQGPSLQRVVCWVHDRGTTR